VQDTVIVAHTWTGEPITFHHPAVQSTFMFLGEFLCIVPYFLQRWRRVQMLQAPATPPTHYPSSSRSQIADRRSQLGEPLLPPGNANSGGGDGQNKWTREKSRSVFVLAIPTLCDTTSTMMMNIGLYYTSASVFQMLRGTVLFFAGASHSLFCVWSLDLSNHKLAVVLCTFWRMHGRCCGAIIISFADVRPATWHSTPITTRDTCLRICFAVHQCQMSLTAACTHAAVFTMIILKRRLYLHHWQGMMLIAIGAFVVGLSSLLNSPCPSDTPPHTHSDYDYDDEPFSSTPSSPSLPATPNPASHVSFFSTIASLFVSMADSPLSGINTPPSSQPCNQQSANALLGNLFVMAAQIFSALQFVMEEKYVKQYRMPVLLAVGLEGFWGLILSCAYLPLFLHLRVRPLPLLVPGLHTAVRHHSFRASTSSRQSQVSQPHDIPRHCLPCQVHRSHSVVGHHQPQPVPTGALFARSMYALCRIQGPDGWPIDDAKLAFKYIMHNHVLQLALLASVVSMALYNFFGVSVTKKLSSTTRLSIDACRTAVVWVISLAAGWEHFVGIQLLGFLILICGSALYNELLAEVGLPENRSAAAAAAASCSQAVWVCCRLNTAEGMNAIKLPRPLQSVFLLEQSTSCHSDVTTHALHTTESSGSSVHRHAPTPATAAGTTTTAAPQLDTCS
jgi:drug/metabolite transporter (DMT)-like permease